MRKIVLKPEPIPADRIPGMLKEQGILINQYAQVYFSHSRFSAGAGHPGELVITIASLQEIGFENGATLDEIFRRIPKIGLKPCPPDAGVFLRLAWTDQPKSNNSVLSGTHKSPDLAVTVLSEPLEQEDDFPKGLYLRNVDGTLWLRGYICDETYRFPGDAFFAFETRDDAFCGKDSE